MKQKLKSKVQIFRWSKNSLPTNDFIKYRNLIQTILCARGCQEMENYLDIDVHCKFLIEILIKLSEWGCNVPIYHSFIDYISELLLLHNIGIYLN